MNTTIKGTEFSIKNFKTNNSNTISIQKKENSEFEKVFNQLEKLATELKEKASPIEEIKKERGKAFFMAKEYLGELDAFFKSHTNTISQFSNHQKEKLNDELLVITKQLIRLYQSDMPYGEFPSHKKNYATILAWFCVRGIRSPNVYLFLSQNYIINHKLKLGDEGTNIVGESIAGSLECMELVLKDISSYDIINIINQKNKLGYSPLLQLVKDAKTAEDYDRLLALYKAGADPTITTTYGSDFWLLCNKNRHSKQEFLAKLLKTDEKGLDPLLLDNGALNFFTKEEFEKFADKETSQIAELITKTHLFGVVLDALSENRSSYVNEQISYYLKLYADQIKNEQKKKIATELASIFKGFKFKPIIQLNSFETIIDNELSKHTRYAFIRKNQTINNFSIVTLDGGEGAPKIQKNKNIYSYGITHLTTKDSQIFKEEIEESIQKKIPIEETVRCIFEKTIAKEQQEDGSCTYFSLKLLGKFLWAKKALEDESIDKNKEISIEEIEKRIHAKGEYKHFETSFLYNEMVHDLLEMMLNMDCNEFQYDHSDRYNFFIDKMITCLIRLIELERFNTVELIFTKMPETTLYHIICPIIKTNKKTSLIKVLEKSNKEILDTLLKRLDKSVLEDALDPYNYSIYFPRKSIRECGLARETYSWIWDYLENSSN